MKKAFLLLCVLFLSIHLFAQQGISFQGIARDKLGNALINNTINVEFTIGSFVETQGLVTDDFGVFSATIGSKETVKFKELDFDNNNYDLIVSVDNTEIYKEKFNTVPYAKTAENGVPIGTIVPFAGPKSNNPPTGWLYCDGTSYAITGIYGKLFTAIGYTWGKEGGNFRVPDLRGYFLRGAAEGETVDPDRDSRTAKYSGGNKGDAVGSYQSNENKNHNHTGSATGGAHYHRIKFDTGAQGDYGPIQYVDNEGYNMGKVENSGNAIANYVSATELSSHEHTVLIQEKGGNESRPVNASVVYIIKY
jgi:microcystin-dependent protein